MGGMGAIPGINMFQPFNPWGSSLYSGSSSQSRQPAQNEPDYPGYYPETEEEETIPNVKGHWVGTWQEALTDPNADNTREIHFYITEHNKTTGKVKGTVQITGWDVSSVSNWEGESEEVSLTGHIDEYSKLFLAHYFYAQCLLPRLHVILKKQTCPIADHIAGDTLICIQRGDLPINL